MSSPNEPERRGWSDADVSRIEVEARREHHEAEEIVRNLSAARLQQLKRGSRHTAAAALQDPTLTPSDIAALAAWLGEAPNTQATKPFRQGRTSLLARRWLPRLTLKSSFVALGAFTLAGTGGAAWMATPLGSVTLKQDAILQWQENGRKIGIQSIPARIQFPALAIDEADATVTVRHWMPRRGYYKADVPFNVLQ